MPKKAKSDVQFVLWEIGYDILNKDGNSISTSCTVIAGEDGQEAVNKVREATLKLNGAKTFLLRSVECNCKVNII